jgi:hypothetical protein
MKTGVMVTAVLVATTAPVLAAGGGGASGLCTGAGFAIGSASFSTCVAQVGGDDTQDLSNIRVPVKGRRDKGRGGDQPVGDLTTISPGHDHVPNAYYALPQRQNGFDPLPVATEMPGPGLGIPVNDGGGAVAPPTNSQPRLTFPFPTFPTMPTMPPMPQAH